MSKSDGWNVVTGAASYQIWLTDTTTNQTITVSGAVSGSGATSITAEFASTTPVQFGGTGSTTLTGILKGNGTGSVLTAVGDTDYQKPITLTTSGSSGMGFSRSVRLSPI